MQLVIEIDEELYDHVKDIENRWLTPTEERIMRDVVRNGKPLPKGHGDLKDADAIVNGFDSSDLDNSDPIENYSNACNIINSFPVIVPADIRGDDMVDFETKSISAIEIDTTKAKKYIKEHTNQPIGDIPLWVLASMGAWALTLEQMKEVLDEED